MAKIEDASYIKKAAKNADNLIQEKTSQQFLIDSISILKFEANNRKRKSGFMLAELILAFLMAAQSNTVSITRDVEQVLLSVLVALIAIVFMGYTFSQALINDNLLVILLSVDDEKKGSLSGTNKYFVELMIYQLLCLLMNLVVIIIAFIMPNNWHLCPINCVNVLLATLALTLVLYCTIEGIWEMKSFVFNLYNLFNLHAYSTILKIIEEDNNSQK